MNVNGQIHASATLYRWA